MIKLAESSPNYLLNKSKMAFETQIIDDLEGDICQTPPGQLQFLTIVNHHLLIVNQYEEVILFPLSINPYVQFCIELICGASDIVQKNYKRASNEIQSLMRETLAEYGMTAPCE